VYYSIVMTEVAAGTPLEPVLLAAERLGTEAVARDRKFSKSIAVAFLLHSLLLISIGTSKPRQIGDPSGAENAISVELITEADLKRMSDAANKAGAASTSDAVPQPPVEQQSQPQQPADNQAPPEQTTVPPSEQVPAAQSEAKSNPEPKTITPDVSATSLFDNPDILALPLPGATPQKKLSSNKSEDLPKQQPQKKPPETRTTKLDLSQPAPIIKEPEFSGSGSAGFERPPGITRSGANDTFARGVIRALKSTMPQLSNTFGRVTVRIVLDQNGNLSAVKVLKKSDVAGLDQSVVFAGQQTTFPFPPANSLDVDRIFVVTYIYR
jgi:periplasmic protein TonB